jgi:SAM-dependent methyltransferase
VNACKFAGVDRDEQRLSFGPAAGLYDRIRPRYPVAALEWMLGDRPLRVVDLGAGTGILTRQLRQLGHDVVPVEPDASMRAKLDESVGAAIALAGSAEGVPLPDAAADAVVAGQAYHWFKRELAHPEIARVLRPGGVFAPVWNERDERVPWVAELSRITDGQFREARANEQHLADDGFGPLFSAVERATFPFSRTVTGDELVELMKSRSYYLSGTPDQQARLEAEIRRLVRDHPALTGLEAFDLPYVTFAYRATKR